MITPLGEEGAGGLAGDLYVLTVDIHVCSLILVVLEVVVNV